jgi:hypothetical protein
LGNTFEATARMVRNNATAIIQDMPHEIVQRVEEKIDEKIYSL